MSLPYSTATSGDRALLELQKTLAKFGCQSFGTMTDAENGETIVQFRWRNRPIEQPNGVFSGTPSGVSAGKQG